MLSLCFIASLVITVLGFLNYWTLYVKDRTLDFGIMRALGVPFKNIVNILIGEQILRTGSIIMGLLIGSFCSNIFIPMLNLTGITNRDVILPFKVVSFTTSYIKLSISLVIISLLTIFILIKEIKKIDLNQALKLGTD